MFLRVFIVVSTVLAVLWFAALQQTQHERQRVARKATIKQSIRTSPRTPTYTHMSKGQMEQYLRTQFHDAPVLVVVAACESSFRHTRPNGEVLRGKVNSADIGVMQINLDVHGERLAKLGLNPFKLEDNVRFARMLYQEKGLQPWSASEHCWRSRLYA